MIDISGKLLWVRKRTGSYLLSQGWRKVPQGRQLQRNPWLSVVSAAQPGRLLADGLFTSSNPTPQCKTHLAS